MNAETLPTSVRYIKNGAGGRWWPRAKALSQVHAGWDDYPDDMIKSRNFEGLKIFHGNSPTQDYNALVTLLEGQRYIWVTIEDGYLWWCTVSNQIGLDPAGSDNEHGHFWLVCDKPWNNKSLRGDLLALGDLPGTVTQVAGYRATVCEPSGSAAIRRAIVGEKDSDVSAAEAARTAFVSAVTVLVKRLHPRDFELLIDLLLQRTGWARAARRGGVTEGIDIEVENASTAEIAFVQVKSQASQAILDDYVKRFETRRERYARMIFAVHTTSGPPLAASASNIHVWDGARIADLVVTLGLADWVGRRT